jgi:hypothetical protein
MWEGRKIMEAKRKHTTRNAFILERGYMRVERVCFMVYWLLLFIVHSGACKLLSSLCVYTLNWKKVPTKLKKNWKRNQLRRLIDFGIVHKCRVLITSMPFLHHKVKSSEKLIVEATILHASHKCALT